MKILFDQLAVCVDCTAYIANGEVFDDGNDITAEHAERMRREWPDQEHLRHMVNACPEECEGWFSWSPCEGCGSDLGGERHPAAVLGPDDPIDTRSPGRRVWDTVRGWWARVNLAVTRAMWRI